MLTDCREGHCGIYDIDIRWVFCVCDVVIMLLLGYYTYITFAWAYLWIYWLIVAYSSESVHASIKQVCSFLFSGQVPKMFLIYSINVWSWNLNLLAYRLVWRSVLCICDEGLTPAGALFTLTLLLLNKYIRIWLNLQFLT